MEMFEEEEDIPEEKILAPPRNKSSEPKKVIVVQKIKPEEIVKMDQEFIQEMLNKDLNRVMVNKGAVDAVSRNDPQDIGKTKPAEKGTPSGDKANEPNNQDRGNKR